ncbi:MFS transporter [Pseudorhodoferax sp. Leaf274]|uniref:MFS transporter n=1 Tax=Pseudorhodoferax sp. Leaf274 TaxID=1736318 RepID=UPI000702DD3D|nr:MFS transporter [Pseudorhodoferax sp. Leaf274]KQP41570.1 MFS transporter [Pseudorhodoferax sp. Leaf274]
MTGPWMTLAITLAVQAMVSMALLTLPVMAPVVASAMGVSAALVGVYVALVYAGAMAASLAAGAAVARFGAIRVSQAGLLLCAAGLALCAVPHPAASAIGAVLIGLGYGPITPASSHLLSQSTPAHRMSLVFSVKQTGVPLGGMLAGALVPSLMLLLGWQGALLASAAANLACALLAQPLRTDLDADRQADKPMALGNLAQPIRLVLGHPALKMLAACSFVFSIAQLSLTTYLVTYLNEGLAYGLVAAGLALSVAQFGGVAGRILWGWVADRGLGARRMLALLAAVMALSSAATALLSPALPPWLVLAVLVVFGASAIGWNGVYLAEVARQAPPGLAGVATGGTLAFTFFGVVLGPPVFGALSALFQTYRAGYLALAVPTLLCCVALLRVRLPGQGAGAGR